VAAVQAEMALFEADVNSEQDRGCDQGEGEEAGEAALKRAEVLLAKGHDWFPFLKDKHTLHDETGSCQASFPTFEVLLMSALLKI
jgi:hypothetical protein